MTDDILLIDTDERVRTLTLNRPQSRNALSAALRDRFFAALADAEADDDIDVVILTGADPVFCAGLDLKELAGQTALPDISPRWPAMTKPVIGAINGAAVTGGLELALYCDILIASEHARFADTHARVGLLPTWGLSVRLPQKVGIGLARRMSLTGYYLSATDALRPGQHAQRGGLAATGRTDQNQKLPVGDVEVQVVDGRRVGAGIALGDSRVLNVSHAPPASA